MIEAGSVVDECIVTDGVRVASGSSYRRSVLRATPVRADGIAVRPVTARQSRAAEPPVPEKGS